MYLLFGLFQFQGFYFFKFRLPGHQQVTGRCRKFCLCSRKKRSCHFSFGIVHENTGISPPGFHLTGYPFPVVGDFLFRNTFPANHFVECHRFFYFLRGSTAINTQTNKKYPLFEIFHANHYICYVCECNITTF